MSETALSLLDVHKTYHLGRTSLEVLRGVHKAWPTNAVVQYHLGWVLVKTGKKAEGMELLKKAAASDRPDASELAKKAIAEFT